MNIAQLVPRLNIGGVEKGTVEVARYLALHGHKAVVVSSGGPLEKNLAAVGARHYKLPIGKKDPLSVLYCYRKLREIIRRENIDIVHGRSRVPSLTGYMAARAEHRAFITTAHGQYKKHIISRVMGWGKIVIVANQVMARYMIDNFGVPAGKIVIIPRGVDLEKFAFRQPGQKPDKTFRAGMIARFTPLKGHIDFLKAAAYVARKMPNFEILFMGDKNSAREEYVKKIEFSIKHLLLDNITRFRGADEDVAEVLNDIDVLVSANREQEAFGRSVIEAQARGVPVVATRVGGVVENIEDGVTGLLCEPSDPSDMAEKIIRYAKDPGLRDQVACNARKSVEGKFALKEVMETTIDAYKKVLEMKKILVFKISSFGDIVLSIPSLRAIRGKYGNAVIKVLVDVKFRKILERCPYIDEVITCDFGGRDSRYGFLKLAARLRAEDFDISIDLQNNRRSHLLAFLSMIPERFGFENGKFSGLLNRKTGLPRKALGPVEHQGCVLGLLGVTGMDPRLELWSEEGSEAWLKNLLEANWIKEKHKVVGICISASKKWPSKNWGVSRFVALSDMLAKEKGIRVILIGTDADDRCAREFMERSASKPVDLTGKTDIPQFISLIKRCNVVVTGDSAPMHVAAAVGTPFVVIFGPTDPARHLPPAEIYKMINKKVGCSPCYKGICYRGHKCMKNIRPQEVFRSIMDVIR